MLKWGRGKAGSGPRVTRVLEGIPGSGPGQRGDGNLRFGRLSHPAQTTMDPDALEGGTEHLAQSGRFRSFVTEFSQPYLIEFFTDLVVNCKP